MGQIKVNFLGVGAYSQVLRIFYQLHKTHSDLRPDFYLPSDTPLTREWYETILENPENSVLGAMDGERLVGICFLMWTDRKNPLCVPRKVAHIDYVCVDEEYRGQGIGEMLCREAIRVAQEKKAVSVELSVWNDNRPAVSLYQKVGFKPRTLNLELIF